MKIFHLTKLKPSAGHPAIVEVAAVTVEADQGGEDEVLACIVLQEGHPVPKLMDHGFLRRSDATLCVPRYVGAMTY